MVEITFQTALLGFDLYKLPLHFSAEPYRVGDYLNNLKPLH